MFSAEKIIYPFNIRYSFYFRFSLLDITFGSNDFEGEGVIGDQ